MRELVQEAPGRCSRRQTNRQPRGPRDSGTGLPRQWLHRGRVLQAKVHPDRIHHCLRIAKRDEGGVSRCNHAIFPSVNAATLTIPQAAQLRSPLPSPVIGRLRFTRSPASKPSLYAAVTMRRPTACMLTRRTSVSRKASSTIVYFTIISAVPVARCARTAASRSSCIMSSLAATRATSPC